MVFLSKFIKAFFLFLLFFTLFLFSPVIFFRESYYSQINSVETENTINLYENVVEEKVDENIEKTGDYWEEKYSETDDSDCMANVITEVSSSDDEVELVQENDEQKKDESVRPNCSIEEEVITDDYHIYELDGVVYIQMLGDHTFQERAEAYEVVRGQGCRSGTPNLEWIY